MQTISRPYRCSADDRAFLDDCRRVYSAAVRAAYANAADAFGAQVQQKPLRDLVKSRFAGGALDAWGLHCATLEGMDLRKRVPDGRMVFGGRAMLERRRRGSLGQKGWKRARLRPMTIRGDKQYAGNRHFRLGPDGRTCTFTMLQGGRVKGKPMVRRSVTLELPTMIGKAGEVLRQAAALAATRKIDVTFRIGDAKFHVTVDPEDLPDHPERRRPALRLATRAVGLDLNLGWVGIAAVENTDDPARLDRTKPLDWALVELAAKPGTSRESVTEMLSAVCGRAIAIARKFGAATIAVEDGLGKLRSTGPARDVNRTLNYWARARLIAMLRRKANLAGITVVEVRRAYSTMIGNLAFEAPDACAAAMELSRRGIAVRAKIKDLLPVFEEGWRDGLRKDLALPAEAEGWAEVHRAIKAAKLGVRRPHPRLGSDRGGRQPGGIAVRRLGRRRRGGLIARPVSIRKTKRDSSVKRQLASNPTP